MFYKWLSSMEIGIEVWENPTGAIGFAGGGPGGGEGTYAWIKGGWVSDS